MIDVSVVLEIDARVESFKMEFKRENSDCYNQTVVR